MVGEIITFMAPILSAKPPVQYRPSPEDALTIATKIERQVFIYAMGYRRDVDIREDRVYAEEEDKRRRAVEREGS